MTPSDRFLVVQSLVPYLPKSLLKDCFDDRDFCQTLDIETQSVITLGQNMPFEREALRSAVRSALDSSRSSEITTSTGVAARVEPIADRGGFAIRTADIAFQIPALRLLSESRAIRERAMEEEIAGIWLPPNEAAAWRAKAVTAMDFDDIGNLVADINATPERFSEGLRRGAIKLNAASLCPSDRRLYERTVGPPVTSASSGIPQEMVGARGARLQAGVSVGLPIILHSCGGHDYVPIAECRGMSEEVAEGLLDGVGARQAPWQTVGALHLALEFGMTDVARTYAKKFTSAEWVDTSCQLTAAAFVIAALRFNVTRKLQQAPVRWRRLACFSHASLIASSLLDTDIDANEFWTWVKDTAYAGYGIALACERRDFPRWHQAWVLPSQLRAELAGRLRLLEMTYAEAAQKVELDAIVDALVDREKPLFVVSSSLPGPLEGHRGQPTEARTIPEKLESAFIDALNDAKAPNCRGLLAMSMIAPPSERMWSEISKYLSRQPTASLATSDGEIAGDIVELAYVIGSERKSDIAHQLSESLLKGFVQGALAKALSVGQALIELAIAIQPTAEWSDFLTKVFERLAFSVRQQSEASALVIMIDTVGHVDAAMIAKLARARLVSALMARSRAGSR